MDGYSSTFAISQTQDEEVTPKENKRLKSGFKTHKLSTDSGRTNDEIHTTIEFCPVIKAVMDTKQYQRLRGLKQLGTSHYTYMNANHTRFEHSLGVAHLGERMVSRIMIRQPNLNITEKDKLCVKIAGLCHDLGHGPFSHVFDGTFPQRLEQHLSRHPELHKHYEGIPERPEKYNHEAGSCMMIDALLKDMGLAIDMDNLDEPLKQIGDGVCSSSMRVYDAYDSNETYERKAPTKDLILTSRDWVFVKEMIIATPFIAPSRRLHSHESGFIGRPHRHQEFLYDIVANRHSGLDVDKIDYFARDDRRAFRGSGQIDVRLIDEVFVAWGICPQPQKCFRCKGGTSVRRHLMPSYPTKLAEPVSSFFHRRMKLHSSVYTHKTTQASTFMIADILALADPFFRISSHIVEEDPKLQELPLSRAMLNPNVYCRLRDSVVDLIEDSKDPRLKPAQDVIRRLHSRNFYKCVAVKKIDMNNEGDVKLWGMENKKDRINRQNSIEEQLFNLKGEYPGKTMLDQEDVMVECRSIHMGAGEANPLVRMRFLPKREHGLLSNERIDDLPEAREQPEDEFNAHIPRSNQENSIRAFCRSGSKDKCELLSQVFHQWETNCEEQLSGNCFNTFDEEPDEPAEVEDVLTQEEALPPDDLLSPIPGEGNVPASTESVRAAPRQLYNYR